MGTWYLDTDDEITDAVARLRSTTGDRVVLVVPPGSRIATGRINFRLLQREATARDLKLAIASPDEQVRSLAVAAGVLARPTADEADAALVRGETAPEPHGPDEVEAQVGATVSPDAGSSDTEAMAGALGPGEAVTAGGPRRRRVAITVSSVIVLGVAGAIVGLRVLPTAQVTIVPHTRPVGPIAVAVTASTAADSVDVAAGEIPVETVPIQMMLDGTFSATGSDIVETRATGEVVFTWLERPDDGGDSDGGITIDAPTRVFTLDGIEFRTTQAVFLPAAAETAERVEARAPIEAARAGVEGNVPAGTITVVPSLESQSIAVTNPEATSGGRREVTPVITQEDWDAAATDLRNRLAGELSIRLRDPATAPEGRTLFPETATLGEVEHQPAAEDLVGQAVEDFSLAGTATGSVLAVDEALVEQVAAARLAQEAPPGTELVASSVRTEAGNGSPRGDQIRYAAIAEGDVYTLIDAAAITAQVRGLPVSEARSILEGFGSATVTVWPDFVGNLPDDESRIRLDIQEPSAAE